MQVSLGLIKACESRLLEMREMEEMVEFMKNEVPNWEASLLQVPPCLSGTSAPPATTACHVMNE